MSNIPAVRGNKKSKSRVDDQHKGEEEDGEVGGDGDRPVLLGEEVQADGGEEGGGKKRPAEVEEEEPDRDEVENEAVDRSTRGWCWAVLGQS